MSDVEEVRYFYRKWLARFMIVTVIVVVVAIASVIVNIMMFANYNQLVSQQQELLDQYDDTIDTLWEYDIRVDLNVTWLDYSFTEIAMIQDGSPKPFYDDNRTIDYWEYNYKTSADFHINTTETPFRFLYMLVSVPNQAHDIFNSITCQWTIADQTGLFKKNEFHGVSYSTYYQIAEIDISSYMWKEIAPQVEIEITLGI